MDLQDIGARLLAYEERLSPHAARTAASRGRDVTEAESPYRTPYQRDRDRILHCKAFRRLKHKTQVFINPLGDHYVTRMTHTLEVTQVARTIARALNLNEDLTEAIGLGHDLGHTPFGHAGEAGLNGVVPGGFYHTKQSVRVVEVLENEGRGLNLMWEVRDGIGHHSKPRKSMVASYRGLAATLEGQIVKFADGVAYLSHDIDDAIRAGIITAEDIPREVRAALGDTRHERLGGMVEDIIRTSWDQPAIAMSPEMLHAVDALRDFMFENVYLSRKAKPEEEKAGHLVATLYQHFVAHPEDIPADFIPALRHDPPERRACDYVAGMTDRYALQLYEKLYVPQLWWV